MERTKWTHREWAERDAADARDAAAVDRDRRDNATLRRQVETLRDTNIRLSDRLSEIEEAIDSVSPGYLHPDTGQSMADWIVDSAKQVETLREALEAVRIRASDGDRRTDWLPTIRNIACTALAATAPRTDEGPRTASEHTARAAEKLGRDMDVMTENELSACDRYASAALTALLRDTDNIEALTIDQFADEAWMYADAMIRERRKRLVAGRVSAPSALTAEQRAVIDAARGYRHERTLLRRDDFIKAVDALNAAEGRPQ